MKLRWEAEVDLTQAYNKVSPLTQKRAKHDLMNVMLSHMTNYVPMRLPPLGGSLRMSGRVERDLEYLVWSTSYAVPQYYGGSGKVKYKNYSTPGTGPFWDKVASANHFGDWERVYANGLGV